MFYSFVGVKGIVCRIGAEELLLYVIVIFLSLEIELLMTGVRMRS